MTSGTVQLERRAAQRFDFHLPLYVRSVTRNLEGCGFTQDLSARGAFFFIDLELVTGEVVELTLVMPSEITLAENMRVRCRGTVLRTVPASHGAKAAAAVQIAGYEFLPEAQAATTLGEGYSGTPESPSLRP